MSDLTEFLLAQIATDEAAATRDVLRDPLACPVCGAPVEEFVRPAIFRGRKPTRPDRCEPCGHALTLDQSAACFVPHISSRMAAEVEAKRRIVERWSAATVSEESASGCCCDVERARGELLASDDAVRILAAIYSDHPDYRAEWKP